MKTLGVAVGLTVILGGGLAVLAMSRPGSEAAPDRVLGDAAAAERMLEESARAYRKLDRLRDTAHFEFAMPGGPRPDEIDVEYAFGKGTDASVRLPELDAVAVGNSVFVTTEASDEKYMQLPLDEDLGVTMGRAFRNTAYLLPMTFDMRADRGMDAYLQSLSMGIVHEPRLTGVTDSGTGSEARHTVAYGGENGEGRVHLNGTTMLIERIELEAEMPGAQTGDRVRVTIRFSPQIPAASEPAITFDPVGRRKVANLQTLKMLAVGDRMPDFTLPDLDGQPFRLADMRGSVVVLDFWATWCGWCRRGLPLLDEFNTWAKTSGHPIAVYAVDTFERGETDTVPKRAEQYWSAKGYGMPTLLDADSAVAQSFGFKSIPMMFVIGPDGRVTHIHEGFDPRMVQNLQRDVTEALE